MSGYSGTPLIKKLGINPGTKLHLVNAPENYFSWLQTDFSDMVVKSGSEADLVHLFIKSRKELEERFNSLIKVINPATVIWVSWYKKSSGIATDVTEDVIRECVLSTGWVDVKVCAVNEEWSGLKIVKRKELH